MRDDHDARLETVGNFDLKTVAYPDVDRRERGPSAVDPIDGPAVSVAEHRAVVNFHDVFGLLDDDLRFHSVSVPKLGPDIVWFVEVQDDVDALLVHAEGRNPSEGRGLDRAHVPLEWPRSPQRSMVARAPRSMPTASLVNTSTTISSAEGSPISSRCVPERTTPSL